VRLFAYNAQGDLTATIDPLGNVAAFAYDQMSRLVSQTDPRGKTTTFEYDALDRVLSVVSPLGGTTGFSYDPDANLLAVIDPRGNMVRYEYDPLNRPARRTDPLGAMDLVTYDPNGNVLTAADRKGQITTYTYDALSRPVRAEFADGSVVARTYDPAGRLTELDDTADPYRPVTFEYDSLDRLVAETTARGRVQYRYDPLGRRTGTTVAGQAPVSYSYDAASRPTAIQQEAVGTVTFGYDALDRRFRLVLPNGVSAEYQYDAASRLTSLIYRNALGVLGDLTYQYDAAGNRIAIGGSFARTLLPTPVASAAYDAANRQVTFGGKAMTSDANGNLATLNEGAASTVFTWDARNRLASLNGGTAGAFAYDARGRRVRMDVSGELREYQYDELDISRESVAGVRVGYVRTLTSDEAICRLAPGSLSCYLADALTSTVALADSTGSIATAYSYEPFGAAATTGAVGPNAFQFTGRENDGTGLYYYRSRYYHAGLARFLSQDPLRIIRLGNLYPYASNSPLTFVDPTGLLEFTAFGGATFRIVTPGLAADASAGIRAGTNGFGVGRVEGFGGTRATLLAGGFSAGRGAFAGAVFRDVSKFPRLAEAFIDTPIGSLSLFFDGDSLVGAALGGPSKGLGIGLFTPDMPGRELRLGFDFPTLFRFLGQPSFPETPPRLLGERKR